MDIYNHHKVLFIGALSLYVALTIIVAVSPAIDNQIHNGPLPKSRELSASEIAGKGIFINEGCTACHTQQVRDLEMDKVWGARPGVAGDYARISRTDFWRNTATLMGSERTGPDLTNVGVRQPSKEWNLLHLYNPRIVSPASVMPSYAWLFEVKEYADSEDVVLNVPEDFRVGITGKIVATTKALQLVSYLRSLKQVALPDGKPFAISSVTDLGNKQADGATLYAANCQGCHQENGLGLPGAFPPLKGSKIVLNDDPEIQTTIIMLGYNGRVGEGYGIMPAVGTNNHLSPEQISAIINHERSSWGNNSKKVTAIQISKIIASLKADPKTAKKK